MQEIHSIGATGAGRIFGGDRRLRPHQNQALKCPRCDSLNTKFCYYNNYNLSQPRHFCKSCRRYWTKGGVLRNVPVGGGCRKTKRSSKQQKSDRPDRSNSKTTSSHSSSESSSLMGTANTVTDSASVTVTEDNRFFSDPTSFEPLIDQGLDTGGGRIFHEIGGGFANLMTSSTTTAVNPTTSFLGFGGAEAVNDQQSMASVDELKIQEYLYHTVNVGLSGLQNRSLSNTVNFGPLEWQQTITGGGGGDQTLFDLTGTVDQAYWSQNQWVADNDQQLFIP